MVGAAAAPPAARDLPARFRVVARAGFGMRFALTSDTAGLLLRIREVETGRMHAPVALQRGAQTWSAIIRGGAADVEVATESGSAGAGFRMTSASLVTVDPLMIAKGIGDAGSCERDVQCFTLSGVAANMPASTGLLFVTAAGAIYACTGTLMNTDPASSLPYLLTASSCVLSAEEAATLESWWNFEATACNSRVSKPRSVLTGGGTLLARNETKGYSFLQLKSLPAGAWLSGWDPAAASVGKPVMAIHHPGSDLRKLSLGSIVRSGSPLGVRFTTGVTEGTSTGSGIFVDDQLYVGTLVGGVSSCSNPTGIDDYAPFSAMYPDLQKYLRPSAAATTGTNYSDIWWNPSESGWGLTIADHETQMFIVLYTYTQAGRSTWFFASGGTLSNGRTLFTGDLFRATGPAYTAGSFDSSRVAVSKVGAITVDFAPAGVAPRKARVSYSVDGVSNSKLIERFSFGNAGASWGSDYTDLWFNPEESGWGFATAHHGDNIFGVLYVYDVDGQPTFFVMPGGAFGTGFFSGDLFSAKSSGAWYGASSFNGAQVSTAPVGNATLTFPKQAAALGWRVNNVARQTLLARLPFGNAVPTSQTTRAIIVGINGAGGVSSNPPLINCPGICAAAAPLGSTFQLVASPAAGSRFAGWSGDCSGTGACSLSMTQDRNVTARFEAITVPTDFTFTLPAVLPDAFVDQPYDQSACTPRPSNVNALCVGGVNPAPADSSSYHFTLETGGGFAPFGIDLALNGLLQGKPTTVGKRTFGICAVNTAGRQVCRPTSIEVKASAGCVGNWNFTVSAAATGGLCPGGIRVEGGWTVEGVAFDQAGVRNGTLTLTNYPVEFTACVPTSTTTLRRPVTVNGGTTAGTVNFDSPDGPYNGNYQVNGRRVNGAINSADGQGAFVCDF